MLSRIRTAIPSGNRKMPMRYYRMMNGIMDRMWLARGRYTLAHAIQTQGMELLRFLILNIPLDDLDQCESDVERYTTIFKFHKNSFLSAFDSVCSGTIEGGNWVEGNDHSEVILNVDIDNPLQVYPFDKDWPEWQDIRSVRLLYHDSYEIPEDFAKSMFDFKKQKPKVLVMSIDAPTLCFKWYKYMKEQMASGLEPSANEFLKQYEYSYFFDDLYEIFAMNLITEVMLNSDDSAKDIAARFTVPIRFANAATVEQGVGGIKEYIDLLKTGAMKPADFVDTRWFLGGSMRDKMNQLDKRCILPMQQRYLWEECLKWLPYLKMFMAMCQLYPDGPQQKQIRDRASQVYVNKFKTVTMSSIANSAPCREFVDSLRDQIESLLTEGV